MVSKRKLLPLLASAFMLGSLFHTQDARAQGYVETFGQNRVQNRKFDWKFFDTKHFRVYHYDRSGRQLGRYVAEEAENNIKVIEQKMGGQFPDRFSIILYNSYEDYRQTNVGLKDESQISQMTISGTWNLTGDKLVVYHTGNHSDLQRQIQAGMAQVVMERMVYGESFKKMAKTQLLMNLPPWVTEGFIAYLTDGWNTEANSEWKRMLDAQPKTGFYEFSEKYPEISGKAFWKFVADNYGKAKMKALLSEMEQKTSLNKAMKNPENLGLKITTAYDSCMRYYRNVYALDLRQQDLPDSSAGIISLKVPKDNTIIRNIMVSPRGSEIVYTSWKEGKFTIYSQKTAYDQVRSVLLEGGEKDMTEEIDPNYPMMAWSNGGNKLAILYKKGKKVNLRIYNSFKGRIENYVIPPNRFDRVLGMSFMQDDDKLVLSAIRKSQTDLYQFTIKGSKMTNITDDAWDDINPVFVSGGSRKGILFLSNRPKPNMNVPVEVNQLPNGPMNVYFYNTTTQRAELLQCSDVKPGQHIVQAIQYGPDNFAYLYDENGIMNKFVIMFGRDRRNMDSAYALPVTNYNTSIIAHQYNVASGNVADVIQQKNKYMVYFHKLDMPTDSAQPRQLMPTILSQEQPEVQDIIPGSNVKYDFSRQNKDEPVTLPEVKNGTAFQSEFSDTVSGGLRRKRHRTDVVKVGADKTVIEADSSTLAVITDSAYVKMKPSPYKLSFKPDGFNVRLDNSILFSQYQPYGNNGGVYQNPDLSVLTTVNMIELMEDHKITAGFQLPLDLSSSAYFLQYKNTRKRMDWSVLGLRTQHTDNGNVFYYDPTSGFDTVITQRFKNITTMVQGEVSYPFDRLRSLHVHTALREDKLVQKSENLYSLLLELPNTDHYWSLSRVEYIYDNTLTPELNIRKGTRYKLYTEYMSQLNGQKVSCYNFGIDFRTYQPIYRNITWATKIALAHSDGTAKVQYQLGGVDNWYRPKTDNNGTGGTGDYGFMMLATNLRGYKQAAQKGNTFGLFNTEIRVPIVSTFFRRPAQSALLKNLQLVGFADGGSAYDGFLPGNTTETTPLIFSNAPSTVVVQVNTISKADFILGYGVGLRTMLFGYFVRADVSLNGTPMVYFALGTDF
jgi:hypothetical protein